MNTTTKTTYDLDLEMPPSGGDLAVPSLEDEAHALRILLDRSENFKVAVGQKLLELLKNRFGGNRNALRDWYEDQVVEGKAHRAWSTVERYLTAVKVHGADGAGDRLERFAETHRQQQRKYDARRYVSSDTEDNNINTLGNHAIEERPAPPSEYEQRRQWLAQMDHLWFRGKPEWRKKWLDDRGLKPTQQL